MAPRAHGTVSVETLSALLEEHRRQMEMQLIEQRRQTDLRHAENRESLKELKEYADETLLEVRRTNGRVNELEVRMVKSEARHIAVTMLPSAAGETRDWKVIGTGIGAVFFVIWGAVSVLKFLLDFAGKVGTAMVGK